MPCELKRVLFAAVIANILSGSNAEIAIASESDAAPGASSQSLASADFGMSVDPLLTAIEQLESDHDAKCHSSANRFEDFLFGTPLGFYTQVFSNCRQLLLVLDVKIRGIACSCSLQRLRHTTPMV